MAEPARPELLSTAPIDIVGRLTEASNVTLLGRFDAGKGSSPGGAEWCVYKPIRGERPLWDFPDGTLAGRERAAYLVSEAAGWHCVPTTLLRLGPLGDGMVQQWVGPPPDLELPADGSDADTDTDTAAGADTADQPADADEPDDSLPEPEDFVAIFPAAAVPDGWLPVFGALDEAGDRLAVCHRDDQRLQTIALFDAVTNNADRKAPHLIPAPDGRVLGVDHGLTFHQQDKLRTVLWGWAGQPIPTPLRPGLRRLTEWLGPATADHPLDEYLTIGELRALRRRVRRLQSMPVFPEPPQDRTPIPWPPL